MTLLETLHLRMAGTNEDDLVEMIRKAADPTGHSLGLSIFCHSRVQGDFLIQLRRDGASQTDQPSDLGLRIASLLRTHGLVEHSVWVQRGESA